MKRRQAEQTILNAIGLLTATFTAATTDIITANTHGLKTGDKVVLTTTDTLPAGLATSTVYYVIKIDANTFYLSTRNTDDTGQRVDVTDTGTGTHTFTMHDIGNAINTDLYARAIVTVNTGNSANLTIKFQGAISETCPDFSAAQSAANRWDYIQAIDMEDGSTIDGDTGIAPAGTDDNRILEVNVNHLKWLNVIVSGYTAGDVTVKVKLSDNK